VSADRNSERGRKSSLDGPSSTTRVPLGAGDYGDSEEDFLGAGRMVTTTQVTTPLLPVLTPVPSNNRVYGKVAAGVAASLGGNVSATLNAATTIAREGGNDFTVSCEISVSFQAAAIAG
jgi:hypothetical protein